MTLLDVLVSPIKKTMTIFDLYDFGDFRSYLKAVFQLRQGRNPSYSYRAFSRDLGLSSQVLNNVLNQRYGFSRKTATQVAMKLSLYLRDADYFVALVESDHARSESLRQKARERAEELRATRFQLRPANSSQVSMFTEWYIPAILELVTNQPLSFDKLTVAVRLGISLAELENGLRILVDKKILAIVDGKFTRPVFHLIAESPTPQPLIRRFHRQVLMKAHEAVEVQDNDRRKSLSAIFSFDTETFEEAKRELAEFQTAFCKKYSTDKRGNSVYAISVNLFQLDKGTS